MAKPATPWIVTLDGDASFVEVSPDSWGDSECGSCLKPGHNTEAAALRCLSGHFRACARQYDSLARSCEIKARSL